MPRNLIGGVATIVIGVAYLAMAYGLRESALSDTVGPAGFPKSLAYALIILGAILCAQSLVAIRARRSTVAAGGSASTGEGAAEGEDLGGVRAVWRAAGMLALGIVYLTLIRHLGYLPSIALLIIAAALYLGTPFSWRGVAIGAAGAVVYWVIFVWILGIPQPPGLLGMFS
jgi:hypothetical protein